jgi:ribosome maturation factor RimP
MSVEKIKAMIAPVVAAMDIEFIGCEFFPIGRGQMKLRVYIDTEQGVTVDDCEKVSRQLSAVLDVEDIITPSYRLEVSSPGLNRPLFELAHFERYLGERVKCRLRALMEGRRQLDGKITAVEDDMIVLEEAQKVFRFHFSNVEKAHLVPEID